MKISSFLLPLATLAALSLSGCFVLQSASDSVSAILDSASQSVESALGSVSGGGRGNYDQDVKSYARAFAVRGGDERDFLRGISQVADRYGITGWDEEPEVLVAAGQGLREGGMTADEMVEFEDRLAALDRRTARLVMAGFTDSAQ